MTIARPPPILADADAGFLELCASFATTLAHVDASSSVRGGDASAGDAMIWQVAPAMRTVLSEDVSHSRGRVPPERKRLGAGRLGGRTDEGAKKYTVKTYET